MFLEDFAGFVGDGVNDDTPAVLAAIATQKISGGAIQCRSRRSIKLTGSILVDFDDFCWDTLSSGSVVYPYATSPVNVFRFADPSSFPSTVLQVASAGGSAAVQVLDPSNCIVGRHLNISVTRNGETYPFVSRIRSVNGNTVYLCDPVPLGLGISPSESHSLTPFTGLKRARVSMRLDGSNVGGWPMVTTPQDLFTSRAIYAQGMVDSEFDLDICNFGDPANFGTASAVRWDSGYNNRLKYRGYRCGANGEGEIETFGQTGLCFDLTSHASLCFGPCLRHMAYSRGSVSSSGSYARGVKLHAVKHSAFHSIQGCGSGATGVCISGQTSYNVIGSVAANGNSTPDGRNAGNRVGVWFSDESNVNNDIGRIQAYGNQDRPLEVNLSDQYNRFGYVETDEPTQIYNPGAAIFSLTGKEPAWNV